MSNVTRTPFSRSKGQRSRSQGDGGILWRPPAQLDNLASKNVLSNAIIYWLYPFRGCIIATFITKTWLSSLMWDTNSVIVFLALSPCVLIEKYLHVASLDLGLGLEDLASTLVSASRVLASALASTFWPRLT